MLPVVESPLWIGHWSLGIMPKIRAIPLCSKQRYSKAEIVFLSGLLQGEEKAKESEISPRERGG